MAIADPHTVRGKSPEDHRLIDLLDPVAEAAGFEIVRVRLSGGAGGARRLQIMAEREDGDMRVEDCARLARVVGEVLDDADAVAGAYSLEVSSPGIDRPLTRRKDFALWEGCEARIEIDRLAEGRKRFKGELAGLDGDNVALNLDGDDSTALIPLAWIVDARLVVTDALMQKGAAARAARLQPPGPAPSEPDTHDLAKAPSQAAPASRLTLRKTPSTKRTANS